MGATTSTLTTTNTTSSNATIKSDISLPITELHVGNFSVNGKNYKLFYIKGKTYRHLLKFDQTGTTVQPTFTIYMYFQSQNSTLPAGSYYGLIGSTPNLVEVK